MPIKNYKKILQKIPHSPGVYFFKDATGKILYIGKAVSLKNRVASYFVGAHERRIERMLSQASTIDYQETDSAIEALVFEANLIRKHKPKYNAMQKDDKTFVQIGITNEDFPRVILVRQTEIVKIKQKLKGKGQKLSRFKKLYGPFPSAYSAKIALKILRKIFPFRTKCLPFVASAKNGEPKATRKCLDAHIGLCPGVCNGSISKEDYQKTIQKLMLFFEGGKKQVVRAFEREMKTASKRQDFESAAKLRNQIFALNHIHDVALIKSENFGYLFDENLYSSGYSGRIPERIEAYDISHTSGENATGSMVVFTTGKIDTDEYRQFRIKNVQGANDPAQIQEVLERRLAHTEWSLPHVILVDGGIAQFRAAKGALQKFNLNIPIIALAKGPTRKGRKLYLTKNAPKLNIKLLEGLRDEAHRFAIKYHRKLSRAAFLRDT